MRVEKRGFDKSFRNTSALVKHEQKLHESFDWIYYCACRKNSHQLSSEFKPDQS